MDFIREFFAEGPDQTLHILIVVCLAAPLLSLIAAMVMQAKIKGKSAGSPEMVKIATAIRKGAMAFLRTEYFILFFFVVIMGGVLLYFIDWPQVAEALNVSPKESFDVKEALLHPAGGTALCFVIGALFSVFAGYIGMRTATIANVRTTEAAKTSLGDALRIAFSSGTVMGLMVVGLGTVGIIGLLVWRDVDPEKIFGFSMGASSIALFARVGGGIYTKAADVGADLVGKVEAGIPEDDPRNPAVVADNVGDNVGDVAGMGADLYESYVGSIIASMALGAMFTGGLLNGSATLFYPLGIAAAGIIASLVGTLFVRTEDENKLHAALFRGLISASFLLILFAAAITFFLKLHLVKLGEFEGFKVGEEQHNWGIFFALVSGLILGVLIGKVTEYYTSEKKRHAKNIAKQSETGPATNVISGLATGMQSTAIPLILIAVAVYAAYYFAGLYGIGISAVGMLSTLGISLGIDAYGPVADNAGGIAEMSGCPPEVRERTDALDAAGNTTAAIGKGFAIGSAALTALALFTTFAQTYRRSATEAAVAKGKTFEGFTIDILSPEVTVGLLVGAMLPFLFSALTMKAVGKAAFKMIEEVRRQFRDIPGLMEGTAEPKHGRCVSIATRGALGQMIIPGLLAVVAPIAVGALIGPEALGGLLAGALSAGVVMAIFMANAGGAWDNAKKYIEAGNLGGKGSDTHKAAVVGDTVGDPFKDTSGPSINILIKLMCIVSLIFIPLFVALKYAG
jgi:K(+)-stimulated pyrophosphate-energized sodium pump